MISSTPEKNLPLHIFLREKSVQSQVQENLQSYTVGNPRDCYHAIQLAEQQAHDKTIIDRHLNETDFKRQDSPGSYFRSESFLVRLRGGRIVWLQQNAGCASGQRNRRRECDG